MNDPRPYYRPLGMEGDSPSRGAHWLPIVFGAILATAAAVIVLVLVDPGAFGISPSTYPYRFGPFGGVFFLFFLLLVMFFVVRVVFWSSRASRYGRRHGNPDGFGPDRPVMVARMRYARGEITREQYEQILQDLGRRPGPP